MPMDLQQQVWPTDDFELAASYVPVSLPEDDLFAGVPSELPAADALARSTTLELSHDTRKERAAS